MNNKDVTILTGSCKDQFHLWYLKKIRARPDVQERYWDENIISWLYGLEIESILAVYKLFFDSWEFWILETPIDTPKDWTFKILMPDCMSSFFEAVPYGGEFESREEAINEAVKKANELFNQTINV